MAKDWNRRVFLRSSVAGAGTSIALGSVGTGTANASPGAGSDAPHGDGLRIERTTVEYADTLLGTEVEHPRLTWELTAGGRGARQSAYRVRVAPTEKDLVRGQHLVWDSGRVESDRTVGIIYAGPALKPRTRYHWQVRVWDGEGRPSAWSAPRWWETTLPKDAWQGFWIGAAAAPEPPGFQPASWIWSPGSTTNSAPAGPVGSEERSRCPRARRSARRPCWPPPTTTSPCTWTGRRCCTSPSRRTPGAPDISPMSPSRWVRHPAAGSWSPHWRPTAAAPPSIPADSSSA